MRITPRLWAIGLAIVLLLGGCGVRLAQAQREPLPHWTIARSKTWDGIPASRAQYMATVGLSEWTTGLQLSGFSGAGELEFTNEPAPSVEGKLIRVTALKARILGVYRTDNSVRISIRPEPKGYEVVGVIMVGFPKGSEVTFVFQDAEGEIVHKETKYIE